MRFEHIFLLAVVRHLGLSSIGIDVTLCSGKVSRTRACSGNQATCIGMDMAFPSSHFRHVDKDNNIRVDEMSWGH